MFDTSKERKAMEEVVQRFSEEMKKVRTGRAHPDMLSGIKVEAYGQFMSCQCDRGGCDTISYYTV